MPAPAPAGRIVRRALPPLCSPTPAMLTALLVVLCRSKRASLPLEPAEAVCPRHVLRSVSFCIESHQRGSARGEAPRMKEPSAGEREGRSPSHGRALSGGARGAKPLPRNKRQRELATVALVPWKVGVALGRSRRAASGAFRRTASAKRRAGYGALAWKSPQRGSARGEAPRMWREPMGKAPRPRTPP